MRKACNEFNVLIVLTLMPLKFIVAMNRRCRRYILNATRCAVPGYSAESPGVDLIAETRAAPLRTECRACSPCL
jgi:hypothetical protein